MSKNVLMGLIIIVIVVVGLVIYSNSQKTKEVEKVGEVKMPTETKSSTLIDGNYSFSKEESEVKWEGKKILIKDWVDSGIITIASGNATVEKGMVTDGDLVIDMTSIEAMKTGANSGEDKLSGHLKSADFFDVEKYPTSEFKITSVLLDENKNYKVEGELTIKETTKIIEFPVDIYMDSDKLIIDGFISVNRADFNVRYGSQSFFNDLGNNVIDDNFTLKVRLVGMK
jgi:polyisoprenoid-binding protein YceI